MYAVLITLGVFLLSCGALYAGGWIASRLPQHHRSNEAQLAAQYGISMMATLAALVLGFMVTSARATFDRATDDIVSVSASIVLMDRALSGYGPQTAPIRAALRSFLQRATSRVAANGSMREVVFRIPHTSLSLLTQMQGQLLALVPANPAQQWFQRRALLISGQLAQQRILTSEHEKASEPTPLLALVSVWIVLIFLGMGTFTSHNRSVRIVLCCTALAFSGSIFLIMELESPYTGLLRVSGEPLLRAAQELALP